MENLENFKERLDSMFLSQGEKLDYMELKKSLMKAESLPIPELLRRALRIKPLVRLQESLDEEFVLVLGHFHDSNKLCFIRPHDIRQSYLFDFKPANLSYSRGKLMEVSPDKLIKVGEFTCYHKYGGHPIFLRPSVDEVLQQIPESIDIGAVNAFEICFESWNARDVYDPVIDRHVSTVILYSIAGGLPKAIRSQGVILDGYRHTKWPTQNSRKPKRNP